ncbi:MAG: rhodanese-related sulfurtransferase, partial [Flavitalea sp.]
NCKNDGCHLLFIQCEECAEKFNGCCSAECKHTHELPEEEQKLLRKGRENGIMVFNKSKVLREALRKGE